MKLYILGALSILGGLSIWGLAVSALLAWWALCFGSVIVGIALLFLAPHILMLPFLIHAPGTTLIMFGVACIVAQRNDVQNNPVAFKPSLEDQEALKSLVALTSTKQAKK